MFKIFTFFTKKNKIYVIKDGVIKRRILPIKGLKVRFKGRNNTLTLEYPYNFKKTKIVFCGNGGNVTIMSTNERIADTTIFTEKYAQSSVLIKKNVSINSSNIYCWGKNSKITIGEGCMLSYGVTIKSSDGHAIKNCDSGEVINQGSYCEIGDRVWLGMGVSILKNVKIANNTIVGEKSLVTKSFEEQNCIIAGIPAKIIKTNVFWTREKI